ncbi:MAG: NRDE family protein [Myxococcaceae bacterium]|nr:NRDE family protein [Myxococcaceae bacterium]
MCTLALAFRKTAGLPVVVAANRDEALDRPAVGPFVWPRGFLAPRDERAGGTWLGLTRSGLFLGVTNRFPTLRDAARESRGALVAELLEAPDARTLHQRAGRIAALRYNAFHLMYADARDAFITWSDGEELTQLVLEPGLHVVTERSFGGDETSRVDAVRRAWPEEPTPEALQRTLRLPETYMFFPDFNYGTRSSMVLLSGGPAPARLFWAEGQPPTPPPFVERPELIAALQ